jgi:hypothetical protein
VHREKQQGQNMSETRTTAIAVGAEIVRTGVLGAVQVLGDVIGRAGVWAADTAQQFGALLSALMGPAVVSAYAFTTWSLAGNLGWTDTFVFTTGPLSNWLVWLAIAVLVNLAAAVLRRHAQGERQR